MCVPAVDANPVDVNTFDTVALVMMKYRFPCCRSQGRKVFKFTKVICFVMGTVMVCCYLD